MKPYALQQRWRSAAAALALVLSLAMCALAGRLNETAAVLGVPDGGTAECRLEYLESLGWTVEPEPQTDEVALPEQFDQSYQPYLALQRECGFDLTPYAGQTVTRYCYTVTNYPIKEETVQLDLLVCQGQIIGGDVRSSRLDGFMQSLKFPSD